MKVLFCSAVLIAAFCGFATASPSEAELSQVLSKSELEEVAAEEAKIRSAVQSGTLDKKYLKCHLWRIIRKLLKLSKHLFCYIGLLWERL